MTDENVSRRSVLQAGAGTAAAAGAVLVVGADPAGAAPARVPTFLLDAAPSSAHCRVPSDARGAQNSLGDPVAQAQPEQPPQRLSRRQQVRLQEQEQIDLETQAAQQAQVAEPPDENGRTQQRLSTGRRINEQPARGGCAACTACIRHGENKIFATAEDANRGRAHRRCKCTVVAGPEVSPAVYDALFAGGRVRSVDRRDPRVAELMASSDADGVPVPILAPTVPILVALAGGYWWWRSSRGRPDTTT